MQLLALSSFYTPKSFGIAHFEAGAHACLPLDIADVSLKFTSIRMGLGRPGEGAAFAFALPQIESCGGAGLAA